MRKLKYILLSERRQNKKTKFCIVFNYFGKGKSIETVKRSVGNYWGRRLNNQSTEDFLHSENTIYDT
jgi:hypothetical protein